MTASTPTLTAGQLALLRWASLATAVGAFVQLLTGGYNFTADQPLVTAHIVVGILTIAFAAIATIAAFVNRSKGGNSGLAFHVLGTLIFIVIQYAIGTAYLSTMFHMAFGVLILISAIAMTTLAFRKPLARP